MTELGSAELGSVVHEVFIRASIGDVWAELTKSDEVQKAMFDMKMDCSLEVGAPFRMRSKDGKYTGIVGDVLEVDAPHRFSFTFQFTAYDDPPCRVTYELSEEGDGTRFRMISDRLPPDTKSTKQMTQGGAMIAETLKAVMETGKPPFKVRALYVMFALMAPFTPARCKSERWP